MKKTKWPGNWKVSCQRCGFWFPSSEIKKEWTGLLVCEACWEPKHPQLMIKIQAETSVPAFVSKDGTDTFVFYCSIEGSSGYADLGQADCARADWNSIPYTDLLAISTNGH